MNLPSISLAFCEGTSDKIYKVAIEEISGEYVVNFAFGRRGNTLNTGTKTDQPVSLEEAQKIYDKLVLSKTAKGYKVVGGAEGLGTSVANKVTDKDQRDTGIRPQLLNPITEDEAEAYLLDNDFCAQEKFDGKRMTIRKVNSEIIASNKKGLSIGFPDTIASELSAFDFDFVVDGEAIGDTFYAFDLLQCENDDIRENNYANRINKLMGKMAQGTHVVVAKTVIGTADKRKMMAQLKKAGKEGIVFKKLSAKWYAGRPASGGSAVKCKFWKSLSAIVSKITANKRSVSLQLIDGNKRIEVGKVTISPDKEIPKTGDIVEIRYLYAYPEGSLYQPIYLGVRDDVDATECLSSQRIFKASDED